MDIEKRVNKATDALMRGDYEAALESSNQAYRSMKTDGYSGRSQAHAMIERLGELARAAQSGLAEARDAIRRIMAEAGDLRLYDTEGKENHANVSRKKNIKF